MYFLTRLEAGIMNKQKNGGDTDYHMDADEFRALGHRMIDWIADYHQAVESYPVLSQVSPGDIRAKLPKSPPQQGQSLDSIFADIDKILLPGITHWQSPNFFAYFPSNLSGASILGDLLCSGLGVQGMLWATSPSCTELETHVLDWLVDMLGLPTCFLSSSQGGGVIQDSASNASLCALIAAREQKTQGAINQSGVADSKLIAYASNQAHSSIEKGIKIAGLGQQSLRLIDVDDAFAMDASSLEKAIVEDLEQGLKPFFVCATLGSTSSNAIDPIDAIAEVCERYQLWLHVDAAMSGTAALCEEYRWINEGLDRVDSYAFNPHKWMFTNFDCNCFYVRDRKALILALGILPEYLKNQASNEGSVIDYRDWQIPLGRRFRALKLWFVIRHYGIEGLAFHVREHISLAHWLKQQIEAHPEFELCAPVPLNLVCFRHLKGDTYNQKLLETLNKRGSIYLTHTRLNGKYVLRMCIGQAKTQRSHVESAWQLICEFT